MWCAIYIFCALDVMYNKDISSYFLFIAVIILFKVESALITHSQFKANELKNKESKIDFIDKKKINNCINYIHTYIYICM